MVGEPTIFTRRDVQLAVTVRLHILESIHGTGRTLGVSTYSISGRSLYVFNVLAENRKLRSDIIREFWLLGIPSFLECDSIL